MTENTPINSPREGDSTEGRLWDDPPPELAQWIQEIREGTERATTLEKGSLIDVMGVFLSDLNFLHGLWRGFYITEKSLGESANRLRQSATRVTELITVPIVPPPGQTDIQYAAWLLALVDEACHLSRFVSSYKPDDTVDDVADADKSRTLLAMHQRIPLIYEDLRKARRHLQHIESLAPPIPSHDHPDPITAVAPLSEELRKDWIDWTLTKVAKTWFPNIKSNSGWTDFANGLRKEGLIVNHPTSKWLSIRIHKSVFRKCGLPIPPVAT